MAAPLPTVRETLAGPAGIIELAAHRPEHAEALAIVAHPHPLFGGSMDNKVVTTLARAAYDAGAAAYRFNFRGVGGSAGSHDEGRGETQDLVSLANALTARHAGLPLWLCGFSFGGAVSLAATASLTASAMVLVAPGFARMAYWPEIAADIPPPTQCLLIHGSADDVVPLAGSLEWARANETPVAVIPEADHFFHRRLHVVRRLALGAFLAAKCG